MLHGSVRRTSRTSRGGVGSGVGGVPGSRCPAVLDAVEGYHGPVRTQVLRPQHVARVAVQRTGVVEEKEERCWLLIRSAKLYGGHSVVQSSHLSCAGSESSAMMALQAEWRLQAGDHSFFRMSKHISPV